MNNTTEEVVSIVSQSPIEASATPDPTTPAGVLVLKLQELGQITKEITAFARKLSKREKAEVDRLEGEMQERIQTLLLGSRVAEAEIKLETMRQVRDIVSSKK